MRLKAVKTPVFKEGENLFGFLKKNLPLKLPEKSIVVVTSKIVALSQRRVVNPDEANWDELIEKESNWAIPTKHCYLTLKEGVITPNAGIDKSNAAGQWILWPKNSWQVVAILRRQLARHYRVKNLGLLITDSRTIPLRAGVVGMALAYAGFKGLRDYRGRKDIFGYVLKISRTDVADSLATAAVLLMGEAAEQTPLALITGAPVEFSKREDKKELHINPADDLYRPLFESLAIKKAKTPV
ncbi:MAG: coenzyme F420-0:L-glutamate ligase [Candidatus Magasanikbacteria bacterium]|nr:coenzyme F420-0:L-glutamate ligase [Candidatus Magasanikbacteria bacterium]